MLWLSAWGYGLVCGSLLLAGETEGETQSFLDSLPLTRRRLWRVKAVIGLKATDHIVGIMHLGTRVK